jgi:hypothetical protein
MKQTHGIFILLIRAQVDFDYQEGFPADQVICHANCTDKEIDHDEKETPWSMIPAPLDVMHVNKLSIVLAFGSCQKWL